MPSGRPDRSFVAKFPSVATTFGSISSICFQRWPSHAWISSGSGSRLPGGRHFNTLTTNTSPRSRPIPASSLSSSFPAWPTNGSPCLSSWKPGASPTNIRSASGLPTPKTTCVRLWARRQRVQTETCSPSAWRESTRASLGIAPDGAFAESLTTFSDPIEPGAASRRAPQLLSPLPSQTAVAAERAKPAPRWSEGSAAAARAAAAAATAGSRPVVEARPGARSVRRENRELLPHFGVSALRAVGLLAVPDELLEVRLALHADVLVDRHEPDCTHPASGE